ncbi:hypothetical protein Q7P35_001412 [Cladosporium inversicolor]
MFAFATTLTLLLTSTTPTLASPLITKRNIGGIRLCDQTNWTGNCWYGVVPLNECIALNSFKGKVLSFRPDDGTECFLMQKRCDSDDQFVSAEYDSDFVGDLSQFDWIADAESFMCVTEK